MKASDPSTGSAAMLSGVASSLFLSCPSKVFPIAKGHAAGICHVLPCAGGHIGNQMGLAPAPTEQREEQSLTGKASEDLSRSCALLGSSFGLTSFLSSNTMPWPS